MPLSHHHRLALAAATVTSTLAVFDAVNIALTGSGSLFADDSEHTTARIVGAAAHGLTYAALALVLVREADRIGGHGRTAGMLRRVLLASLLVLAVGFLTLAPAAAVVGDGPLVTAWNGTASVAFVGMILSALVLGPVLLKRRNLRPGPVVLAALLPVFGLTIVLEVVAPAWAHPAYLETTLHFGIALLGARAGQRATDGALTHAAGAAA